MSMTYKITKGTDHIEVKFLKVVISFVATIDFKALCTINILIVCSNFRAGQTIRIKFGKIPLNRMMFILSCLDFLLSVIHHGIPLILLNSHERIRTNKKEIEL